MFCSRPQLDTGEEEVFDYADKVAKCVEQAQRLLKDLHVNANSTPGCVVAGLAVTTPPATTSNDTCYLIR